MKKIFYVIFALFVLFLGYNAFADDGRKWGDGKWRVPFYKDSVWIEAEFDHGSQCATYELRTPSGYDNFSLVQQKKWEKVEKNLHCKVLTDLRIEPGSDGWILLAKMDENNLYEMHKYLFICALRHDKEGDAYKWQAIFGFDPAGLQKPEPEAKPESKPTPKPESNPVPKKSDSWKPVQVDSWDFYEEI